MVIYFFLNILDQQIENSNISDVESARKTGCQDIIKRIINDELIIKPFHEARMERAREIIRKRKQYYRQKMSKSVKTSNPPWPNAKYDNSYCNSFYDPSNLEKRF